MSSTMDPVALAQLYAQSPSMFSVDAFSMRQYVLMLPGRLRSADAILAQTRGLVDSTHREAAERFAGRPGFVPALLAPCKRDLEMTVPLLAALVVGENRAQFNQHYLRHLAGAARLGMEFDGASAAMLRLLAGVAELHLDGAALTHFRGYCELSRRHVAGASSGAAVANRALGLAERAFAELAAGLPAVSEIYGASTADKCVRDLSMMLGALQSAMACDDRRTAAQHWVLWVFRQVAPFVERYPDVIWMGVLRHVWGVLASADQRAEQHAARVLAPLLQSGRRFREAATLALRASEIGRRAAAVAVEAELIQRSDLPAVAHALAALCETIAAHAVLGVSAARSGIAREYLQIISARFPDPRPELAHELARCLHVEARAVMGLAWSEVLDPLFKVAAAAARQFLQSLGVLACLGAAVANFRPAAQRQVCSSDEQAWLTLVVSKALELACRGAYRFQSPSYWLWYLNCVADGVSFSPRRQAELFTAFVPALIDSAGAALNRHAGQFLEQLSDSFLSYASVAALRDGSPAATLDARAGWHPGLSRLWFHELTRVALGAESAEDLAEQADDLLTMLAESADLQGQALHELSAALLRHTQQRIAVLDELARQRLEPVLEALSLASAGQRIGAAAAGLAQRAVARASRAASGTESGFAGRENTCVRDETRLLQISGELIRLHGNDAPGAARTFGRLHLLPFLSDRTRALAPLLITALEHELAGLDLDPGGLTLVCKVLRAVYGIEVEVQS